MTEPDMDSSSKSNDPEVAVERRPFLLSSDPSKQKHRNPLHSYTGRRKLGIILVCCLVIAAVGLLVVNVYRSQGEGRSIVFTMTTTDVTDGLIMRVIRC